MSVISIIVIACPESTYFSPGFRQNISPLLVAGVLLTGDIGEKSYANLVDQKQKNNHRRHGKSAMVVGTAYLLVD